MSLVHVCRSIGLIFIFNTAQFSPSRFIVATFSSILATIRMEFAQNKRIKRSHIFSTIIFTSKNALIDSHIGRWRMILHWNTPKTLSAKKRYCPERTIKQNERFDGVWLPTYVSRSQLLLGTMGTRWRFRYSPCTAMQPNVWWIWVVNVSNVIRRRSKNYSATICYSIKMLNIYWYIMLISILYITTIHFIQNSTWLKAYINVRFD